MSAPAKIEAVKDPPKAPTSVYGKIAHVQAIMARTGIAKSRENRQQGYAFRGIDEVYGALSPVLAEAGLNILPRMLSRTVEERRTRNGGSLWNVTVEAEFDFVSAEDGSRHTVKTYGEAMDSADKATNKAMSAAYKYAAFMTFAIPTEAGEDADEHTPEPTTGGMPENVRAELVSLCDAVTKATGENQARLICEAFGVDALPELSANQVEQVKSRLNQKLAAAKEQANG